MGRFGNQAEQLLGSLYFAKTLNRTLIIPPFVVYHTGRNVEPTFLPANQIIDLDFLQEYHSIIPLDEFLRDVAPNVWLKKSIFCFTSRGASNDCNAFDGSPFRPFWRNVVGITQFDSSVIHSPLVTQVTHKKQWMTKYPAEKYPVIAFIGAPSSFPVHEDALPVHKYIRLSKAAIAKGYSFRTSIFREPYIAVHIRHGSDWERACKLLIDRPFGTLFSSFQCTQGKHVTIPYVTCLPSVEVISQEIIKLISETAIETIYIASDRDDSSTWSQLFNQVSATHSGVTLITPTEQFPRGRASKHKQADFVEDLFTLIDADYFIGNCVSSFTAFVTRTRENYNKSNNYFALEQLFQHDTRLHDEL